MSIHSNLHAELSRLNENELSDLVDSLAWQTSMMKVFGEEIPAELSTRLSLSRERLPKVEQLSLFNQKPRREVVGPCTLGELIAIDFDAGRRVYHAMCDIYVGGIYSLLNQMELLRFLDGARKLREEREEKFSEILKYAPFPAIYQAVIEAYSREWRLFQSGDSIKRFFANANPYPEETLLERLEAIPKYAPTLLTESFFETPHVYLHGLRRNQLKDNGELPEHNRVLPTEYFGWFPNASMMPIQYCNALVALMKKLPDQLDPRFLDK